MPWSLGSRPDVLTDEVAEVIRRWKHLSVLTEKDQEQLLTLTVIERARRQLGLFMGILTIVSAVIIALIIYTLTMDKVREIATLKLIGAPDRTIIGLILQQALLLGIVGFIAGTTLVYLFNGWFPRRIEMLPRTSPHCSVSSWSSACWRACSACVPPCASMPPAR